MTTNSALTESQLQNTSTLPDTDKINSILNLAGNLKNLHSAKTGVEKAISIGKIALMANGNGESTA